MLARAEEEEEPKAKLNRKWGRERNRELDIFHFALMLIHLLNYHDDDDAGDDDDDKKRKDFCLKIE